MESAFTVKSLKYHRNRLLFGAMHASVERLISILATNIKNRYVTLFHVAYCVFLMLTPNQK